MIISVVGLKKQCLFFESHAIMENSMTFELGWQKRGGMLLTMQSALEWGSFYETF